MPVSVPIGVAIAVLIGHQGHGMAISGFVIRLPPVQ